MITSTQFGICFPRDKLIETPAGVCELDIERVEGVVLGYFSLQSPFHAFLHGLTQICGRRLVVFCSANSAEKSGAANLDLNNQYIGKCWQAEGELSITMWYATTSNLFMWKMNGVCRNAAKFGEKKLSNTHNQSRFIKRKLNLI